MRHDGPHLSRMPTFRGTPVDLVVDVRTFLEYWLGHLPGAVRMPFQTIGTRMPARTDLGKDARILVYCASGARSAMAAQTLRGLGYRRVIDGGAMASARDGLTP